MDGSVSSIGHNSAELRRQDQDAYAEWTSIEEARKTLRERKAELKDAYVEANRNWPAVEAAFRQQYKGGTGAVFTDEFMVTYGNLAPGEQLNALDVLEPTSADDLDAAFQAGRAAIEADAKSTMAANPHHPINQRNLYGSWKRGWLARQAELAAEMAPAAEGGDPEHLAG